MASIDGSHYFLTVLVPVRRTLAKGADGQITAPMILLREKLAKLPTAMQTPERTRGGLISKFAQSTRTHFARFAVIDRLGYNGYIAADPVAASLGLARPEVNREELARPYLLFAAEFDAPSGSPTYDLAVYLRELWDVMADDLVDIFEHCVDFDRTRITTAAAFIDYVRRCEIDTTLPFNAYWIDPPALPTLTARGLIIGALLAAVIVGGLTGWALFRWLGLAAILFGSAAALLGAVAYVALRLKALGDRRYPASPGGDLPTVLKALLLQDTFGQFVIDHQTEGDAELHAAFAAYLETNKVRQPEPSHPAGKVFR